ncbi:MAG: alpha/beta-hydrolase family protein [Dermatophilaceae bacterium]|nr:alpha/beta-hydrolase family protein [Intrasporangiaceae bacterium]
MTARADLAARVADTLRPWARRSHLTSTLLALAGYLASMSPSLLPRTWAIQGAIAGISATFGYAVGRLLERLAGAIGRWAGLEVTMHPSARRLLLWGWPVLLLAVLVITPLTTLQRHQRTAEIVGTQAPTALELLYATGVALVVFALLMAVWQGISALVGWTARHLNRALPRWVAQGIATVVVLALLFVAMDRLVVDTFIARAVSAADTVNRGGLNDDPPASPLRSGSAASAESWASLGHAGRSFVGSGPTQDEIADVTREPALDPIRVYAGLTGDRDLADTADAVVAELERTGAFEREAILIIATTGTGWINEWVPSSFELLLGGDSAVAAMQYSTLPSALAFIESATTPPEAGTALITAIESALATLPEGSRPGLYLSGESLGAYGANAAFDSLDDMVARVDGAVFTGTPGFTRLHEEITASRVMSSTEVLPVVDDGRHVRFASNDAELEADQFGRGLGPWERPRIVYLQNRSDPVVWWHPRLLYRTPDWLDETRRDSPAEQMSWAPFVTFWQVSADLGWANGAPPGEGHRYDAEVVSAIAAVLGHDPGDDYDAIIEAISANGVGAGGG